MSVSIHVCLIMNHGTTVQQTVGGSARDEFHRFCLRLFDYEPWNHIPQVIEGGRFDDRLHFSFMHGTIEPFLITKSYGGLGGARSGSPQLYTQVGLYCGGMHKSIHTNTCTVTYSIGLKINTRLFFGEYLM